MPIAQRHVRDERPLQFRWIPKNKNVGRGELAARRPHALRERQGRLDASSSRPTHAHHHQLAFATWAAAGTPSDIPDQTGRVAVVTGANSGLGLVTARELARHGRARRAGLPQPREGARRPGRGQGRRRTGPEPELEELDLADLASVRSFADRFAAKHDGLDLLINNAGVMAPPRRDTADGFELQFGTNHLGHFALTGLLLPRWRAARTRAS